MEKPFKSSQPRFICVFAMKREKFERSCQAISKKKNWIRFLERPTSFRLKLLLIHFINFVSFSRWTFSKKYIEIRKLIFFFVKCHANSWDTDSGEYGEPRRSNSIEGPEIKIDDTDFLVFLSASTAAIDYWPRDSAWRSTRARESNLSSTDPRIDAGEFSLRPFQVTFRLPRNTQQVIFSETR